MGHIFNNKVFTMLIPVPLREPLSVKHENSHWSVDIVHPESSANIMQNIVGAKLQIKLSTKPHLDYNKPLLMLQAEYTQECQKGGGVLGRE